MDESERSGMHLKREKLDLKLSQTTGDQSEIDIKSERSDQLDEFSTVPVEDSKVGLMHVLPLNQVQTIAAGKPSGTPVTYARYT